MAAMESHGVEEKVVRIQTPPDYIPVVNFDTFRKINTAESKEPRKKKSAWSLALANDDRRNALTEESHGTIDITTAANLMIQSKRLANKSRAKQEKRKAKFLEKKQSELEMDIFSNYNLTEMHRKRRSQRQIKVACFQKMFLDQLPKKEPNSVKEHLADKINLLQRMRRNSFITETKFEEPENLEMDPFRNMRRPRLRRSIDMTNNPVILQADYELETQLSMADVERELAVAKSREKIEEKLDLPFDRLNRLCTLRANVERIDTKFRSLLRGNKKEKEKKKQIQEEEEEPYYAPSRFTKVGMAKSFFRRHARIVVIVLKWIHMIMDNYNFERELKSFVDIATEIEEATVATQMEEAGLTFDKKYYKANREIMLSQDARKTLTTRSQWRTPEMVKQVLNGLQTLRSLSEYPLATQEKLCKVAWYQTIGAKKAIVRQGHHAESFYFILSGAAIVKKMVEDQKTKESNVQVVARLTKGQSFGEIGLLFNTQRTATVESITPMELLVIGKEDFCSIFMKSEDESEEGDHIKFLKQIPCLQNWPFEVLREETGACLLHYFKRGSLVTDNDKYSEYIYFVKTGACEVMKKLKAVKARTQKQLRPKSHPYIDVILPELGMPGNQPKIDSGMNREKRVIMHADVFREMTEFYASLRGKHGTAETPQSILKHEGSDGHDARRSSDSLGLPQIVVRSCTAAGDKPTPRVAFMDRRQKTEGELCTTQPEIRLQPIAPLHDRRPVSRAKFSEDTPKFTAAHFVLPSQDDVKEKFKASKDESSRPAQNPSPEPSVFVRVELLHPKDSFGLNTLKYYTEDKDDVLTVDGADTPVLAMVSRGAEVVMLSKRIFLRYATNKVKLKLRDHIKIYPPETVMQENMQTAVDWGHYKNNMITGFLTSSPKIKTNVHVTRSAVV